MQPSTVIVSAFAACERAVVCGAAGVLGACGVSAPVRGCEMGGADGLGDGVWVACAASDAHNKVANVLARKILLMRASSSRDKAVAHERAS
jgi:hypothetical protein